MTGYRAAVFEIFEIFEVRKPGFEQWTALEGTRLLTSQISE